MIITKKMSFWAIALICFSFIGLSPNTLAQQSIFDSSALFSNDDEFLKPEQAFIYNFHQKNNKLTISFDIAEGYYLYKKQFKFSAVNATFSDVALPLGIDHEDEFFGLQQIYTEQLTFDILLTQVAPDGKITIRYQGCAEKGLCFPPITKVVELSALDELTSSSADIYSALSTADTTTPVTPSIVSTVSSSEQNQLADMLESDNLWMTLVAFFVGGLLLSFTPCVFPMYPILTGIIVGQGDKLSTAKAFRLSFVYVQGMAITYTLLGIVVALAGAQFQAMFQHPVVLISLSILFIFLALSMFGKFNLALPSSWQNKLNNISNKQKGGSYFGVLIMGAISGLVASPCTTAPLTGALLYISQSGDILLGASALYALSLGMGLPLLVLGSSGGKLLPKAGNWMSVIKNIFGLLLLAVPIFLLERFIPVLISEILWITLLLASAGYFYTINQKSSANFWFGLRHIVIFLMFFYGAQSAYLLIHPQAPNHAAIQQDHDVFIKAKNLIELNKMVKTANAQGKTVMVDLYADWCIACKEFEKYTFPKESVKQALANSVLIQMDLSDMASKENKEIMSHFNLFGLPSILFFNLQGEELSQQRVTGFMGADEFSSHINRIFN